MPQARHLKSPFPCVHRKGMMMTFRATLLSVVKNCIGMCVDAMMIGEAGRVYIYLRPTADYE